MIISVAIADKNREYVERLSEVLQQYDNLDISVFTSAEKLESALDRNRYDIVLLDPDISDERLYLSGVKLVVCLYSEDAFNSNMYADVFNVSKYQRVSHIYKEIIRKYSETAGYIPELEGAQQSKVIAVFSPVGGSGKTLISIAMAQKLAEKSKKVLYISCEQLCSSKVVFPHREDGITELVAALAGDTVFDLKLQGLVKTGAGNVNYIEGFERIVDYGDVNYDEMSSILKNIRKCGIYDVVIVDTGSVLDSLTKAVISEADRVVLVNRPGRIADVKIGMFAEQAVIAEKQGMVYLVNNFMENNSRINSPAGFPLIGTIHNYGNLAEENIIQAVNSNHEIDVTPLL
ncbi:MAG: AAA family ATPase [Lachnospiraceae bacterium]|nr:AAA family ATPase [Lachnospiraceae bacterium]